MFRKYKPLKVPKGMSIGLMFDIASSRQLDIFGEKLELKRITFLFIKEPDFLYKIRLKNRAIEEKQ